MLLPRLSIASYLAPALFPLRLRKSALQSLQPITQTRNATHKSEGKANRAKRGAGKRLGAKKTGGMYIFRFIDIH
jgi:large subunit ribosomal protein L27